MAMATRFDPTDLWTRLRSGRLSRAPHRQWSRRCRRHRHDGETATLNDDESAVIRIAVEAAAGGMAITAGVGSSPTARSSNLASRAAKVGAQALLLVMPYYRKQTRFRRALPRYAAMIAAVEAGDPPAPREIHQRLIPVPDALVTTSQGAIMVKAARVELGVIESAFVRLPFLESTPGTSKSCARNCPRRRSSMPATARDPPRRGRSTLPCEEPHCYVEGLTARSHNAMIQSIVLTIGGLI
ncbi:dihydrodipicolinate synthase family protein [Micromonospora sp. NPDC048839]|uniref:dihydrodipicolinate synthase family protein n=1 Tax=Micromonospora sp. NPDC048839 TaxID=3155641 RepID=UPI0033E9924E